MEKITTCLWFDTQAEEAMNYYVSIFKNSKMLNVNRYGKGGQMPEGTVLTATFSLDGREFTALNGGPVFKFTEAGSFIVHCRNQAEVDEYWDKLTAAGEPGRCGWLKDKYGVSWQIVPDEFTALLTGEQPEKEARMMQVMLTMTKLDVKKLKEAYNQK
jgi:predicted 3-demethylubiquinone-9 3-methyltransferase (glyoxalase superfamily)